MPEKRLWGKKNIFNLDGMKGMYGSNGHRPDARWYRLIAPIQKNGQP